MEKNAELLRHDESENLSTVEPVSDELRGQVQAGQCVAIRGKDVALTLVELWGLSSVRYCGHITCNTNGIPRGRITPLWYAGLACSHSPLRRSRTEVVRIRDVLHFVAKARSSLSSCTKYCTNLGW